MPFHPLPNMEQPRIWPRIGGSLESQETEVSQWWPPRWTLGWPLHRLQCDRRLQWWFLKEPSAQASFTLSKMPGPPGLCAQVFVSWRSTKFANESAHWASWLQTKRRTSSYPPKNLLAFPSHLLAFAPHLLAFASHLLSPTAREREWKPNDYLHLLNLKHTDSSGAVPHVMLRDGFLTGLFVSFRFLLPPLTPLSPLKHAWPWHHTFALDPCRGCAG